MNIDFKSMKIKYYHDYYYLLFTISVRCIDDRRSRVIEGKLRCKELSDYLTKLRAIKRVWISEDATVITTKVSYDPFTNQLIGLTLPIDKENGSPVIMSYEAKDEKHIREHLKHRQSKFVYLVMAQSLNAEIPPFTIQLFGTNSEFKSIDVIKRWGFMKMELEKY